jgi:hypothetical protein
MFQRASSESKSEKKSADEAIRLIDLQIANLRESIRVLHYQRNDHLPISRLPVEILTKIFLLHQKNTTRRYTGRRLDWIGITHVSQRWREIALDFSGLWIRIPFYHLKWATEMVARSQHACPIVKTTYNPSRYPSEARLLETFLQQHLSRIQVLEIRCTSHQLIGKLFQDIQPTSVPCLSTLSLSIPWLEPGTEPSPADLLQILNTQLIDTNSLRKVKVITPTTLSWNLRLFSGLTHLMIGGHGMARTQTSQHEFLDALRRMPALRCLDLDGPVLPEVIGRSSLEPLVYLQDLQDLSVCDTVSTVIFLLLHVNFPPTTRTDIGCIYLNPVSSILPVLVPLKRLLSEKPRTLKLHHIQFTCFEESDPSEMIDLRFEGWVSSGPSSLEGYNPNFPSNNPDFTFFLRWDSHQLNVPPSDIDHLSVRMFELFPPDDVISFSLLSYDPNLDDICYRPLARKVGQLPAMNALYLSYISSTPFLQELDCDAPQEGDDPSILTYPALRYLDFSNYPIDFPDLTALYNYLKKRSELGLGPEKLKMDLCRVNKEATALLEKVVEVVSVMSNWDSWM